MWHFLMAATYNEKKILLVFILAQNDKKKD